jgi:MFS family permease
MSAFEPASSLRSRTFIGLLIAQFLAAFNDQTIHASAMFFAINQKFLIADNAITWMPILFYAPWAIFCTIAGYLADRYSKRNSLVFWKFVEIGIALVALLGFWLGSVQQQHRLGPMIVMATVFLMGTHSAFFVPAKYGSMPEILQAHLLSKGNGLLESLSFLAVILGTVTGGILSTQFHGQEYMIGIVLVILAGIGALASLLIQRMPAANPGRPFPTNPFKPLWANLQILLRSKPLALAVLAIAFFTFMVAFMRGAVYMHGETRNPRWSEQEISLVVAVVALGVGLGSPLAGFLSGGKIELGLVPLGAMGMILSLLFAAFSLDHQAALIGALIAIGFFTGFYIVPMFALLQHRAPKASKGDIMASSNFVNVIGAIAASILFRVLVLAAGWAGIIAPVPQEEGARGRLVKLDYEEGRPFEVDVEKSDGKTFRRTTHQRQVDGEQLVDRVIIQAEEAPPIGSEVIIMRYQIPRSGHPVVYFRILPADTAIDPVYNKEGLPTYLFLAAALMTLAILLLLCRQLPDFFVRALLWLRSYGRYHLKVIGVNNLPTEGPVILATNCDRFDDCMQVLAATDRYTRFILVDNPADNAPRPLLRFLAKQTGMVVLPARSASPGAWDMALAVTLKELGRGNMVGITVEGELPTADMEKFLEDVHNLTPTVIVPVYCGTAAHLANGPPSAVRRVRVVIGHPMSPNTSFAEARREIAMLGEWIRHADRPDAPPGTIMIPGGVGAAPTTPAAGPPVRP